MANDPGADLHQPLAQRGHRPLLDFVGQRQSAQEVAEIVGQRVQLQPNGIGGEAAAGQPGPGDGVLALLDVLLRRAALVVERHHPLGRTRHVGDA